MNPFERARQEALLARQTLLGVQAAAAPTISSALIDKIESILNIGIHSVAAGSKELGSGDACLCRNERYIYIRNGLKPFEQAELIAHELGHWFLDAAKPAQAVARLAKLASIEGSPALAKVEAYGAHERQELQANVFARELLLPRDIARAMFQSGKGARAVSAELNLSLNLVRQQMLDGVLLPLAPALPAKILHPPSPDQAEAAKATERFVNVVAGPGTGKTSTLIERIRFLVGDRGVNPGHILALTFTNKAAFELVERLRVAGIENAANIWAGTFHAFGLEFLRKYHGYFGLDNDIQVGDTLNSVLLLSKALPHIPLQYYKRVEDPYMWLGDVVASIKRLKEELVSPQMYRERVSKLTGVAPELLRRRQDVATLYESHEDLMREAKLVDFVDLVSKPTLAMQEDRAKYSELADKFQYILVDEYQDATRAMIELVRAMVGKHNSLWVVGDVRQAIHHWRGASVQSLIKFEQTFKRDDVDKKAIRKYPLALNRRSSPEVLALVKQCGERHQLQSSLRLDPTNSSKSKTGIVPELVWVPWAQIPEAVADGVKRLVGKVPLKEQVVLGRWTSHLDRAAEAIHALGIPTLYIGELTERAEIKQLLCLMQVLTERGPRAIVGLSALPNLALSRQDLELIADACAENRSLQRGGWLHANIDGLSPAGSAMQKVLGDILAPHNRYSSPWGFVCDLLLERRVILPDLADQSINAHAQRIALWQFAKTLLSGDGDLKASNLTRFLFRTAIRHRIGDTYGDRELPPEAASLDAVRLQTVHGSKGLEFDSVHLCNADDQYGSREPGWSPPSDVKLLVQPEVLDSTQEDLQEERVIERQNLLYVAVSRARCHLSLYAYSDWSLPEQLAELPRAFKERQFDPPEREIGVVAMTPQQRLEPFSYDEFLVYERCPLQHWYRYILKLPREEDTDPAARARFAIMEALEQYAKTNNTSTGTEFIKAWAERALPTEAQDPGLWRDSSAAFADGLARIRAAGGSYDTAIASVAGVEVRMPWMLVAKNGSLTTHTMLRFFERGLVDAGKFLKPLMRCTDNIRKLDVVHIMSEMTASLEPTDARWLDRTNVFKAANAYLEGNQAPKPGYHCSRCPYLTVCPSRP